MSFLVRLLGPEAVELAGEALLRGKAELPLLEREIEKLGETNAAQQVTHGVDDVVKILDGFNTVVDAQKNLPEAEKAIIEAAQGVSAAETRLVRGVQSLFTAEPHVFPTAPAGPAPLAPKAPAAPLGPSANHPAHVIPPAAAKSAVPAGSVDAAAATHQMVGLGSTGKTVRTLQDALGVEVDDIDGRQTTAALKAFQAAHGLRPDGIAGPKTWAALEPTVEDGSRGEAVRRIQRQLGVAPDAIDGPQTTGAVKHFQQAHGLTADGIVGPRTWKALEGAALQGAAGRTMVVQYGPSEREAGLGYRQSGQILEVRDGMVTQDTGRSTVSYKMSDLTANAADAAAVQKMLDPGQDVRISVEPGGVQVTSLDRGHNLDRTQIHSR